jgi:hypothetical protein
MTNGHTRNTFIASFHKMINHLNRVLLARVFVNTYFRVAPRNLGRVGQKKRIGIGMDCRENV